MAAMTSAPRISVSSVALVKVLLVGVEVGCEVVGIGVGCIVGASEGPVGATEGCGVGEGACSLNVMDDSIFTEEYLAVPAIAFIVTVPEPVAGSVMVPPPLFFRFP